MGYYETGGFSTVINALAGNMQELGHEVTVAAHTVRVKPPLGIKVLEARPSDLYKIAEKHDMTHIHLSYPFTRAAVRARLSPYLLTHHGYTPWHLVPGVSNKAVHLGLRWRYRSLLQRVPLITAVSPFVSEQLRELYGLDTIVIPNGVEEVFFEEGEDIALDGDPVIFNSTGWNWQKGVDLLVRDFSTIKQIHPGAKLYVVVPPAHRDLLNRHVAENQLKLGDDVVALPYMELEHLSSYYRSADLYLLTSRWESFGLPIIEAFASGTPVLGRWVDDARVTHIEESEGGMLYRNETQLSQRLEKILDERPSYSVRSREYAQKFHWKDIVDQYLELYQRIQTDPNASTNTLVVQP
ncbi:MAG: glycosyltransferase family 4 protein [Candidatus Bathyarchaeota archaeon]|nr:glycosyltransferase family 4 protein [Candidatus Bathyarchaeota archaeon]